MSVNVTEAEVREARRRRRTRRALVVAAAGLAPALVWAAAAAGGADLTVDFGAGQPPIEVGLPAVLTVALVAALAGWAAVTVLERVTSRSRPVWSALAVAVLAASLVPVVAADATTGTRAALAAMHVVVAGVLLAGMRPDQRIR